jgi:tRNA modification GTPase
MHTGDTIVALASAQGRSPRAIVRLSGPRTRNALSAISANERFSFTPGVHRVRLALGASSLPALALCYQSPRSYTGEDAADLLVVGNPYVVDRLIGALCVQEGVRHAEAGEFTARAFLNGKISVDEAEGVGAIIAASSESERRAADRLLRGETGATMRAWADEAAALLALVEAGIDFTDQEGVVAISARELADRLNPLVEAMRERVGEAPHEARTGTPRVALVGPPNAGKSTLFNALLGRDRSVVSERAGTTRDAIVEACDLTRWSGPIAGGARPVIDLVDLAGLDDALAARSNIDALAHRAAIGAIETADVLVLCDPSGAFERAPWARDIPARLPTIRVRTKADLPHAPGADGLGVCAIDGTNLGPLARAIVDAAFSPSATSTDLIPRFAAATSRALDSLVDAASLVVDVSDPDGLDNPELIADALRAALDALGDVVGEVSPDDVLGRIFSTFCVGK